MTVNFDNAIRFMRHQTMLPWVVLVAGIVTSGLLFDFVQDTVENVAKLRFERQASDARRVIDVRIHSYAGVLYGLRALFSSAPPVSRVQFHRFVASLDLKNRYPSLESVNYMLYVPARDKRAFEESVRRDVSLDPEGYPKFAIRPAGERFDYYVLVYIEPMQGFEFAFGLDLGANPEAKDPRALASAVQLTRDSGQLTASGLPLRIKTGSREYTGLAMRLAVYREGMPTSNAEERKAAFLGSVGGGFNVEDLMNGVLDPETVRHMRFKLYDVGSALDARLADFKANYRLLYDSEQARESSASDSAKLSSVPMFSRVLPIEIGGRVWEAHFSAPKDAVIDRVDMVLPWLLLGGGLLSSLLLFGMFYSLASARGRAEEMAREITRELRDNEASLAEAQQIAHIGNWSLNPVAWSMTWSAEAHRILDFAAWATPMPYTDFLGKIHEDDRTAFDAGFRAAVESGQDWDMDHRIALRDGRVRWAHTILMGAHIDERALLPGTIMDITEQKLAQQELIESQTLLNEAQYLSHLGSWQWDFGKGQLAWSDELYRIYGIDAYAFVPSLQNHLAMIHEEDQKTVERAIGEAQKTGREFTFETRILRPDGDVRRLRVHGAVVKDSLGRPIKMLVACLDITEHKHAEEALHSSAEQLQALSRRLVDIQEQERRQFSRELHDRVGQNLTALSINLDILKSELSGDADPALRVRLDDSAALLESTSESIENVMSELRPPMLDDYGLYPALQWYANAFEARTGIAVTVQGDEKMERPAPLIEIALFRIMQEALNNVVKHARAKNVNIRLERADNHVMMTIMDNGVGFQAAVVAISRRRARLGMVTMRERTQAIGGHFSIDAVPDGGTRVMVRIPC